MTLRGLKVLSLVVVLVMAALGVAAWTQLPADARLPVHWDVTGVVDRTAPALFALAMPVGVAAGITVLFAILPALEPLQRQMEKSMTLYSVAWLGTLAIMAMVELLIALPAFGLSVPGFTPIIFVGLFLVLLGNVLPKSRPSFFVGIRTPWTLTDRENWIATHRLGGRTMILGGLMMMAAPFLPVALRAAWVVSAIVIAVVPPLIYSWWYWRQHRTRA